MPTQIAGPDDYYDTFSNDLAVSEFLLEQVGGRGVTEDLAERVMTGDLERTIDGASTLSVTIADHDGEVLRSGVFGIDARTATGNFQSIDVERQGYDTLSGVDVQVDGVWFRLVSVSPQGDGTLILTFEDRSISLMKSVRQYRHARRAQMTRIQFMDRLVRDVNRLKNAGIVVRAPDEDIRQDVQSYRRASKHVTVKTTRAQRAAGKLPGAGATPTGSFRIPASRGGPHMTARQIRNMEIIVSVGLQLRAPLRVIVCAVMVASEEAGLMTPDAAHSDRDSAGLFQQRPSAGWGAASQVINPAYATQAFMAGVPRSGIKGAMYYNGASKGAISIPALAMQVQRSGFTGLWEPYLADAEHNVALLLGRKGTLLSAADLHSLGASGATGSPAVTTTTTTTTVTPYQFTQGQPGKPEDVWTALKRLAGEVGDRVFLARNELWIVSDPTLMRQEPRLLIEPDSPELRAKPTYQWDRGQPVNDLTLDIDLRRWQVPPGCAIELSDEFGPGAGRWIVHDVKRSLFALDATVDLQRPARQRLEPAPQVNTTTSSNTTGGTSSRGGRAGTAGAGRIPGGGSVPDVIARMYAEAVRIDARHYNYEWGGGHNSTSTPTHGYGHGSGPGVGYDCSGAVAAVLRAGGILGNTTIYSGTPGMATFGVPGGGRYFTIYGNNEHTFMQFNLPGKGVEWWGTSLSNPGGGAGFMGLHSTVGFAHRRYPGL